MTTFCEYEDHWSNPRISRRIGFVGNKAKGRISKRVFQENKARQIFRKTNISYPLIRTCAYQGVRNVRFSENLTCFVFLKHPFWDLPFCLIVHELLVNLLIGKPLGKTSNLDHLLFNPSQVSFTFHTETSHFLCNASHVTGFNMKCNTEWWVNRSSLFS